MTKFLVPRIARSPGTPTGPIQVNKSPYEGFVVTRGKCFQSSENTPRLRTSSATHHCTRSLADLQKGIDAKRKKLI